MTALILFFIFILISAVSFFRIYWVSKNLPLRGVSILKNSGKDAAIDHGRETVLVSNTFKDFLKTVSTLNFWKALFVSFFQRTKNETISFLKMMSWNAILAIVSFILSIIFLFTQLFIWIF